MPVNLAAVGRALPAVTRSWTSTDAILYALGVGAGVDAPDTELEFTTENSTGVAQQVLPTFVTTLVPGRVTDDLGDFDRGRIVHAEEEIELDRPVPVSGAVEVVNRLEGMYDKGSGALVVCVAEMVDATTREPLGRVRSGLFVRGEGGFGVKAPATAPWSLPERAPDSEVAFATRPEQALLYRLNGDRNPLHSDPVFARRFGFPRPILHGLCTYGISGRGLLSHLAAEPGLRLRGLKGRLSRPVFPGERLTVQVWRLEDTRAAFRTLDSAGTVVLDQGVATFAPQEPIDPTRDSAGRQNTSQQSTSQQSTSQQGEEPTA